MQKTINMNKKRATMLKLCIFYLGTLMNICGAVFYFLGMTSNRWVVVSFSGDHWEHTAVTNYGPWSACKLDGTCYHPWVVLEGVDKSSTEMIQIMLAISAILYILGLLSMVLQMCIPKQLQRYCNSVDKMVIVEFLFPIAAISSFTSTLLMGGLKGNVIGQGQQMAQSSSGFSLTLVSILLTVVGIVCMILNRYIDGTTNRSLYTDRWSRVICDRKPGKFHVNAAKVKLADQVHTPSCGHVNSNVSNDEPNLSIVAPTDIDIKLFFKQTKNIRRPISPMVSSNQTTELACLKE